MSQLASVAHALHNLEKVTADEERLRSDQTPKTVVARSLRETEKLSRIVDNERYPALHCGK